MLPPSTKPRGAYDCIKAHNPQIGTEALPEMELEERDHNLQDGMAEYQNEDDMIAAGGDDN